MVGTSYTWQEMTPLCERIHAGAFFTHLETETGVSVNTLKRHYRLWCKANGLEPRKPTINKRIADAIQARHNAGYNPPLHPAAPVIPRVPFRPPDNQVVLAISDLHCPFEHTDALAFLNEVRRVKKATLSLSLGDEIDAASFSRFIPDPDGMTPGQELSKAIEHLMPFYRDFPEMLICESNHTTRPWKKAFDAGLPASFLPTYATLLKAPDKWVWASRWVIDDVLYIHGDNGRSGQYAHLHYLKSAKRSVVIGHMHSYAGVNYEGEDFAVNAGCLIDATAYCFKYAKNMIIPVNLGCAVIYEGKYAEFVPMRTDNYGRWIGRL